MVTAMDMARRIAQAGFRVLPLRDGKIARTRWKNGGRGEAASWDDDVVASWQRRWPHDGYGVACGDTRDGHRLVVVDCDCHGIDPDIFLGGVIRWMTDVVGMTLAESETMLVRTRSGGCHLWWWCEDVDEDIVDGWGNAVGVATRDEGLIDIDLRIPGRGYVVGPDMVAPGYHAGHYAIQADPAYLRREGLRVRDLIRPMPARLVDWLTERRSAQREARGEVYLVDGTWEATYVEPHDPIPDGRRNDEIWRYCRSRRHRLAPEQLRQAAHYVNMTFCRPPLEAGEVERIVAHALTAA